MSESKRERGGPGCLKIGLGVGCVAPVLFLIGVIVIVVVIASLVQAGQKKATEDAVSANAGRGTLDNPVEAGQWMIFDSGKVRVTKLVRPADATIKDMNMFNDEPAAGTEYTLVWYEVACGKDKCNARWDLDLALVDVDQKTWEEEPFIVLDSDLDGQDAIEGGIMSGWQAFQVAKDKDIQALKVKFDLVTLYAAVP